MSTPSRKRQMCDFKRLQQDPLAEYYYRNLLISNSHKKSSNKQSRQRQESRDSEYSSLKTPINNSVTNPEFFGEDLCRTCISPNCNAGPNHA
uniref:Uncharacterized protein n=1 Tax=Solanum lycopersicum TaxID=4081 RepID=A0A3Q7IQ25_SOLLC